jgi:hypothetical protein
LDKKTFLVIDSGHFVEQSNSLSNGGKNKVYYWTNSEKAFPILTDIAPGKDFEHLEVVPHLFDFLNEHKKQIDCIVNWDSVNQDLIAYLREDEFWGKKSIFGCGYASRLEEDREGFKKILKKLKLDVGEYAIRYGVDELEKYNKEHSNIFVKIDKMRGTMETTKLEKYADEVIDGMFTHIRHELGQPFVNNQKFIIEHEIKTDIEVGIDCVQNKHGVASKYFWGIEHKKSVYLGTTNPMPKQLKESMNALAPLFRALDYRGCYSSEERITKDKHYIIDPCPRGALPLTAGYSSWIKNIDEVVYKIGMNEEVEVNIPYKYVLAVPLYSQEGKDDYVRIKIDPKHREFIKYRGVASDGEGHYFAVKGMQNMVAIILGGNDWHELIERAKEEVEFVEFDGKEDFQVNLVDKFPELIKNLEDNGISF